ncbi:MAG: hypothetical protein RIS79_2843 [Verrucomicrobiota bacterium]
MEMLLFLLGTAVLVMPLVSFILSIHTRGQVKTIRAELDQLRSLKAPLKPASQPVPPTPEPKLKWSPKVTTSIESAKPIPKPPPIPSPKRLSLEKKPQLTPQALPESGLSMEQFMGSRLLAWLGGLSLFLGIVFFVKLSLERGWVSPGVRILTGFFTSLVLVASGVLMERRKRYLIISQTFVATGIVALYGVTYAAHTLYALALFKSVTFTFGIMNSVTLLAFVMAVRCEARVIGFLGMLGGFLTPALCSTGRDQALALFGYIALLDVGMLAVAGRMRWRSLVAWAAAGTLVMQVGWMLRFFESSGYAHGSATWVPVGVLLGFLILFTAGVRWSRQPESLPFGALLLAAGAMVTAFVFLGYESIGQRPAVLYALVMGVQVLVMAVTWVRPEARAAQGLAAALGFLHLWSWTTEYLTTPLLGWALGLYLLFGGMQAGFAMGWQRREGEGEKLVACWVPVAAVFLMLLPVVCLPEVGLIVWPALLLADLLVIGVALAGGSLMPVLAALVLTLVTVSMWLFGRLPVNASSSLATFLMVLGGFTMVFSLSSMMLARRHPDSPAASLLPLSSAMMPFLLLIASLTRLPMVNPTPVFACGMILTLVLLTLARRGGLSGLVPFILGGALALQWMWHDQQSHIELPGVVLGWHAAFVMVFMLFPQAGGKRWESETWPWLAAAVAGPGAFGMIHRVVEEHWAHLPDGLLPAILAVPPLVSLAWLMRHHGADNPARKVQAGGFLVVALFFITLSLAWQFERQWITLAWALEGAVLLGIGFRWRWRGMRQAGLAVVALSLVRLFFWDLASSDSVHRIGVFLGVAVVSLGVSWLYQRFLMADESAT